MTEREQGVRERVSLDKNQRATVNKEEATVAKTIVRQDKKKMEDLRK